MRSDALARSVEYQSGCDPPQPRHPAQSTAGAVAAGQGGGTRLSRPAEQITLLEVFRAVERQGVFAFPRQPGHPQCPVGGNMRRVLAPVFVDNQRALERSLSQTTIADLLADLAR